MIYKDIAKLGIDHHSSGYEQGLWQDYLGRTQMDRCKNLTIPSHAQSYICRLTSYTYRLTRQLTQGNSHSLVYS